MLISIVIMPVGYLVAGPLSSSIGFTTTLVGAAIVGGVPAALTALVPGNRAVPGPPPGRSSGRPGRSSARSSRRPISVVGLRLSWLRAAV